MKSIFIKHLLLLSLTLAAFSGCVDDENALNLTVNRVENLISPDNGVKYALDPAGDRIPFLWSAATAGDKGLVVYEVVFDRIEGDFSNPTYRIAADDKGVKNSAYITHKLLNKAAAAAGAKAGETITLKWTVASSKGDGRMLSQESRQVTVTRLNGFVDVPPELYMNGEGAEAKQQFTSISDGEFEIYTSLKAGKSFSFADGTTGTPQEYSSSGVTLEMGGSTTVSEDGVYKISVDFNSAVVSYTLIKSLEMFFPPKESVIATLDYQGVGIWKAKKMPVEFNGSDERYKFRFLREDGSYDWFGSKNYDNQRPTETTSENYYYLYAAPVPWDTESLFAYTYKFMGVYNGTDVDVTVFMQAGNYYYHTIVPAEKEEVQKEIPDKLYINGPGSESGQQFKKLSSGVFEIYTYLEANKDFNFVTGLEGDVNSYSVKNQALVEKGSSQVFAGSPYRIKVDFNTDVVTTTIISKVELYFAPTDKIMFSFDYAEKGEWKATNVTVALKQESWGKDERYKFRFTVNGGFVEWFGSSKIDNGRPNPDEAPSYYFLTLLEDTGRWVYTYKFILDLDGKNIDMCVRMNGDYTHEITKVY
ncbi:MAG: SusE domain-containing protein [Mangrovibacterium sp.]